MAATSAPTLHPVPSQNKPLRMVIAVFGLFWLSLAIAPANRFGWMLEHTPIVAIVGILTATYRTLPLSNTSYALLGGFVSLHSIGAHYGYGYVPLGFWMRDAFDFSRNHYDRIVHLAAGLLVAYPIREIILRTTELRGFWAYYLPLDVVIATSGFYEILEMFVAMVIRPEQGILYLGTQGDVWDAQKDMGMAALGALIAMTTIAVARKFRGRSIDAFR